MAVLGAAGYGKTALIASWLAHAQPDGAVAWLTLDRSDRDPGRLASDLLAALRAPADERLGACLARFEAPQAFVGRLAFVDALHEALSESGVPLTLVLDDVQEVARSPAALEMVDRMLLWLPPRATVVIASRGVPRLRLQRLRLADRLEVISHKDLAFSPSETAEVVRADFGDDATAIEAVHQLTDGWPAGVRMATLALRAGTSTDLKHALRQDDALADYLAGEVLASLEPPVRNFVLEATVDDRVCPSLVDAARGTTDSTAMLERCLKAGLFLTREPGTTDEPWFRWHSLFATHMRARRRENAARSDELERRAAVWWRRIDAGTAVAHALAAHQPALAGDIASGAWLDLVLSGRADTARRIVDDALAGAPEKAELHLARAFVAAERGAIAEAQANLKYARHASAQLRGRPRVRFELRCAMIELFVVRDRAALAESTTRGRELMAEVQSGSWPLDRATLTLMQLCLGMGEARLLDRPLEALRLLREARAAAEDLGYTALKLTAEAEICVPSVAVGRLEDTRRLAEATLSQATAKGWAELPSVAPAYGWLGWLALWQGHPHRARELLERCSANLPANDWGMLGLTTTTHAQACISSGDVEAAEGDVRRGRELAGQGRMPPWWPSLLGALEAMVLVARGRVEEACRLVQQPTVGTQYYLATCYRATVLLRGGLPRAALATLEDFPADRMYAHISGAVEALRAQALTELGDTDGAHAALERALADAAKHGFLEPFLMIGEVLSPLLRTHLRVGTAHPELVTRIRNRLHSPQPASINDWGETLTPREQHILRYLSTDLSLVEVAEAEYITVNTVKTHIAHIYGKLGAKSRREAVRLAADRRVL